MEGFRVFYSDNSAANDLEVTLRKYFDDITATPSPSSTTLATFTSNGVTGLASDWVATSETIDLREPSGPGITSSTAADFYLFTLIMPADWTVSFKGIRVFWRRQVSPAPQAATFNDVATNDWAFQFIEAFAASGITLGCIQNPPQFCPDGTVTRREMAVFFARALGLHWPPF